MLDIINGQDISVKQRKSILNRALHTNPFLHALDFEFDASGVPFHPQTIFDARVEVNRDFYLTELLANFGELNIGAQEYDFNIYNTWSDKAVFGYGDTLPSYFKTTSEIRLDTNGSIYQKPMLPYYVSRGSRLTGEVVNKVSQIIPETASVVLKGFNVIDNRYVPRQTQVEIARSLTKPPEQEWFSVDINDFRSAGGGATDTKDFTFRNDRHPRLILGFCSTTNNPINVGTSSVLIEDIHTGIKWMDNPMKLEYVMPRMGGGAGTNLRTNIYYLPTEYFFEPFGRLNFEIFNAEIASDHFRINMLTRRV